MLGRVSFNNLKLGEGWEIQPVILACTAFRGKYFKPKRALWTNADFSLQLQLQWWEGSEFSLQSRFCINFLEYNSVLHFLYVAFLLINCIYFSVGFSNTALQYINQTEKQFQLRFSGL